MDREKRLAWRRGWHLRNKDKVNSQKRERRKRSDVIEKEKLYRQQPHVKSRMIEATRRWEKRHPEKVREIWRIRSKNLRSTPDGRLKCYEKVKRSMKRHPDRCRERYRSRYRRAMATISGRLEICLRAQLKRVLKGELKCDRMHNLLGCTVVNFRRYIESLFEIGMSWENYGRGHGKWSIDHTIPCSLFDLSKPEHQRRCFHFSNLQPMWSIENSRKNNRGRFQLDLILPTPAQ